MSESPKAICLLPLLYFQSHPIDKFKLRSNVSLRKINSSEIRTIQERSGRGDYPFDQLDIERINYTLEKKIYFKDLSSFNKALEQLLNLVLSMRLYKQGAVGYKAGILLVKEHPRIIHAFNIEPRHPSIVPIMAKEKTPKKPVFALLTLLEEELREYASFCKKVSKFGGREEKWPLPIRYFSRMYEAGPYEDTLVNCMISFEALVFKGEKELREKQTPLALAVSMLIGENSKEREKVKATLKQAYTIRNDIVHGKHPRTSKVEIKTLCWEIEDYLRRSIRKLLIEE
ncbi:MAG: hypothetical protein ACFFCW_46790 [Candidatus Hodarchaeota archaeon]